jgi:hypothetical protein
MADLNTGRYNKLIEIEESNKDDNENAHNQVSSQLEDSSSYIMSKKLKIDQLEDSSVILQPGEKRPQVKPKRSLNVQGEFAEGQTAHFIQTLGNVSNLSKPPRKLEPIQGSKKPATTLDNNTMMVLGNKSSSMMKRNSSEDKVLINRSALNLPHMQPLDKYSQVGNTAAVVGIRK